eukprot:TRINITY_DN1559_c4_g1_i1.p1 TRINITY_DN1559_c4_g1~~TRINITY_DN1559_c4_g1_i1.p1  ORF type:complete len:778 (+),score=187.92 TRINITY_DN1559_c4_g1_i1:43-2376(+)
MGCNQSKEVGDDPTSHKKTKSRKLPPAKEYRASDLVDRNVMQTPQPSPVAASSPTAAKKKLKRAIQIAGALDTSVEKEDEKVVIDIPYTVRKQPYHAKWTPGIDDCKEVDITDGKGLCYIISKDTNSKLALFNATDDLKCTIEISFPGNKLEIDEEAANSGYDAPTEKDGWFTCVLYPGETRPLVKGIGIHSWKGGYEVKKRIETLSGKAWVDALCQKLVPEREGDWAAMIKRYRAAGGNPDKPKRAIDADFDFDLDAKVSEGCLRDGDHFIDVTFPPTAASVGDQCGDKAWVRHRDLGLNPQLFTKIEGEENAIDAGDIDQGTLGDCWLMASIAACAEFPNELVRPMFKDLSAAKQYAEKDIYHIRFCTSGWYKWVVVDGYFPCQPVAKPTGLCFAKNKESPEELWVSVIEKGFAKLHGGYEHIQWGHPAIGIHDLTGYPCRKIDLDLSDEQLFRFLEYHDTRNHIMDIATPVSTKACPQLYKKMGLTMGHAFTLIAVYRWKRSNGSSVLLCKVRNPWGGGKEWTGDFCDTDDIWNRDDDDTKKLRADTKFSGVKQDGIWWMTVSDLKRMFTQCCACFAEPSWWDIRIQTGLNSNQPRHVVEITPDKDTDLLTWTTQQNTRGLSKDDPRNFTGAVGLTVLTQNGEKFQAVANSKFSKEAISVAYESDDDFDGYVQLKGGKKYYIVYRGYPNEAKEAARNMNLVLTLMTSNPVNTRILQNQSSYNVEQAFKYVGYPELNFRDGNDVSNTVSCQINKQPAKDVPWGNMASYVVKPIKM